MMNMTRKILYVVAAAWVLAFIWQTYAHACDHAVFICPYGSGLVEVDMMGTDGTEYCNKQARKYTYTLGGLNKSYSYRSRLFREKEGTLYYRGRRCVEK